MGKFTEEVKHKLQGFYPPYPLLSLQNKLCFIKTHMPAKENGELEMLDQMGWIAGRLDEAKKELE